MIRPPKRAAVDSRDTSAHDIVVQIPGGFEGTKGIKATWRFHPVRILCTEGLLAGVLSVESHSWRLVSFCLQLCLVEGLKNTTQRRIYSTSFGVYCYPFVYCSSTRSSNMAAIWGNGGQAGQFPLEQWFYEMPPVTRWWTAATVATSVLVQCNIVTPFQLFYSFRAVYFKSQVSGNGIDAV